MNKSCYLTIFNKLFIAFILFAFVSCNRKHTIAQRGFYYWKSEGYQLQDSETNYLRELQVQKLYVKLFEVSYDNIMGPVPTAKSDFRYYEYSDSEVVLNKVQIIPTIYIKNEIFSKSSLTELDTLASNILFLTDKRYGQQIRGGGYMEPAHTIDYTEIQIDCDWTPSTKEKYFYLLTTLKKQSHKTISCTLRLYPYKYPDKMGVPPVDKATLMCYNLINPLQNDNKNSILDLTELKSYLTVDKKYPLHLDIVLPIYSWMQWYQNGQFQKLIYNDNMAIATVLEPTGPLWYKVTKDTTFNNIYLRVGDKIKYEKITPGELDAAIDLIKKSVQLDDSTTISFFHLDENNLNQFSHETLNNFYTDFSK
jgi:hypothetical protein